MIVGSKKYACETCIKGHRSSSCKHTDRPLFEIKKKGRPITQCEHCRQLRKEKQVHVKCICEAKFEQQGLAQGVERAAFPNGLPPALGTSVAFPPAHSDDSDHGAQCKHGPQCNCAVPRQKLQHDSMNSQIISRIQELRPLVPRPTGPVHDPSAAAPHSHPHPHRAAPYGRPQAPAYDAYGFPTMPDWGPLDNYAPSALTAGAGGFPSLCGCGDACACPGCVHHNPHPQSRSSAYASCTNPEGCGTCMDCTILALPPSAMVPPNTALSIYDTSADSVADWLRAMSASTMPANYTQYSEYPTQPWPSRAYSYPDDTAMHPYGGFPTEFYDNSKRPDYNRHRSDDRNIDPRLFSASNQNPRLFLDIPSGPGSDASRSRSPSISSASSHGHPTHPSERPAPAYRPSGRVPGMYDRDVHSNPDRAGSSSNPGGHRGAPPLNMSMRTASSGSSRGSTSASRSAGGSGSFGSPASAGGRSEGDSGSGGPSLANLHIF